MGGVIFDEGGDWEDERSDWLRVRLAAASGDVSGCACCVTGDFWNKSDACVVSPEGIEGIDKATFNAGAADLEGLIDTVSATFAIILACFLASSRHDLNSCLFSVVKSVI